MLKKTATIVLLKRKRHPALSPMVAHAKFMLMLARQGKQALMLER